MGALKKHYKKVIVFAVILILGIQFVRYLFPPFEMIPSTFDIYEGEDLELEVKHHWGKYEFTIHNNTSEDWMYGTPFILEVKRGSEWKSVYQDKVAFTLAAYNLPANSSVSDDLNLNFIYGKLPVGKYRIVKEIGIDRGPSYHVAGEFRVWF